MGLRDFGVDAVPECEAGFESGFGGASGLLPEGLVGAAQIGDHAQGERAVIFAVYFDVAFEIPDELAELAGVLGVEIADELAEDFGNDVFAAEGEGCSHRGEVAGADDAKGGLDEDASREGCVYSRKGGGERCVQREFGLDVAGDAFDERANGSGVRSGLVHGFEVELEVADGAAIEVVGLFAQDDLVDEAAAFG